MAQFDYDSIGAEAIALIKEFAKPTPLVLLRSVDGAPVDASKPWRVGTPSVLTFSFSAVVLPFQQSEAVPTVEQDLTVIAPGDAVSVAAAEDASKLLTAFGDTDRISTGGQEYAIIGCKELNPGSSPIMFTLRLRAWRPATTPPSTQFSAS